MDKFRERNGITIQVILTTLLINVFFVGVIFIYYVMLYWETEEEILNSGKLSALSSAEKVDDFLSTGIDTIKLASYSLDNMIRDGRSHDEILDFLLNQSVAVVNITSNQSPGLYGYIDGEYLDGTGWTPSVSYVPQSRPWYIQARANIGRVAVVDPYLDLDSQTIMIALSKTLCDTKSVISMDFSMETLQEITEEVVEQGNSEMEMVLDGSYRVVAHSDRNEVGKNYMTGGNSFGEELVEALRKANGDSFSMRHGGYQYTVYMVPVANEWMCLSVINATEEFHSLNTLFMITILAIAVAVTILIAIMVSNSRKKKLAADLTEDLTQAQSDIQEKDNQIGEITKVAFSDALTGVGTKAAFNQLVENLQIGFKNGSMEVAVVMLDVNHLKYINDSFGHEAGDKYLCGCCKQICDIYKHSPVFRIGGDEFVAILTNTDYDNREELLSEVKEAFARLYANTNKSPWERYSVAVGMSEYMEGDKTLDQILKRADEAMYADKEEFKRKHGRYR